MVRQFKEETQMRKVGRLLAGSASIALSCTVAAWAQDAATKKMILRDNAAALYGLG